MTSAGKRWRALAENLTQLNNESKDAEPVQGEPLSAGAPLPTTATPKPQQKWAKASTFARLIGRLTEKPKVEEEFMVEARRRFLFDDTALRRGGDMKDLFESEERPEEDFNEIVDHDEQRVETFVSQELVGYMIDSTAFRIFIFALIIINSILIGLQTDEQLSLDYRYVFSIFDQLVMATFICEILLKWYYGFWIFWKVGWNVMDFIIILALIMGPQVSFLSSSRILRILRVLRAFRSLRSISALAGLSMVVQTILKSVPDMANICLLLMIILIVLGVMGVSLFGTAIPNQFGNLPTAMFSLFICVTQDGWVQIFDKFREEGGMLYVGGALYFFMSIMLGAFVFANLVVAVVVTNLEMAMKELKEEKAAEVDTLTTQTVKETDDFGPSEDMETVNILNFKDILGHFDFTTQTPLHNADLRGLTADKLEKYFLLLIALEENLVEYLQIRNDLEMVYEVVTRLNVEYLDDEEMEAFEEEQTNAMRMAGSNINFTDLKTGDILSNLMKLEEKQNVTSRDKQTIGDVVRSALDPVSRDAKLVRRRKSGTTLQTSDERVQDQRR